ncbi:2Fe-2S iron-sulfur cluster binding domain-containing protein [Candidatus Woesearchaeota archaeon]|nr:2Fe-2S iron-sulfur cluster binding domain-containing protein [Candidatus Woesearchaeota archaeon]
MAKIKLSNKTIELKDGSLIADACGEMGLPLSCHCGVCGVCVVEVLEGQENLEPVTDQEKVFGLTKNHRFACMCKIKKGEIKIKF